MLLQVRARSKSRPLRADFDPAAQRARLAALGFREIEGCGSEEFAARYAPDGLSRAYNRAFAWATVRKVNSWMPMSVITSAPSRVLTFLISPLVILVRSNVSRWSKSIDGSS